MGNKYRQPPPDMVRRTLSITNRLDTLESSPRAVATTVDSGHWRFVADNGVVCVDFGDQGPGLGRGFKLRRGDQGVIAFGVGGNPSGRQFWRLCDNEITDIITDDAASGRGLARPYIPITATKLSELGTPSQTTTSTTFVTAYQFYGYKQHPRMQVQYFFTTPAGVSAEVVIMDTNTNVVCAGPDTWTGGSSGLGTLTGAIDGLFLDPLHHALQYRVSAGAGTIGTTVVAVYGVQS